MAGLVAQTLAAMLLLSSATADWLENGNVRISVKIDVSDPKDAFPKGRPALDQGAVEACAGKGIPSLVDEPRVNGYKIFAPERVQMTLSAVYACNPE